MGTHSLVVNGPSMSILLGQGAFGTVFKEKIGGATCAVKRIKNYDREAMKEVVTLVQLDSKYIIRLRGFLLEDWDRQLCIIMEYADRGTYANFVEAEAMKTHTLCFKEYSIWRGLRHLAIALSYLHNFRPQPILHRDLKPDNILGVGKRGGGFTWKLADFGLATLLSENSQGDFYTSSIAGTPTYMAPEILEGLQELQFWGGSLVAWLRPGLQVQHWPPPVLRGRRRPTVERSRQAHGGSVPPHDLLLLLQGAGQPHRRPAQPRSQVETKRSRCRGGVHTGEDDPASEENHLRHCLLFVEGHTVHIEVNILNA